MVSITYEQKKALEILQRNPDIEGTKLCKEADCSFSELCDLNEKKLIDIGVDRIYQARIHPVLTDAGRSVANWTTFKKEDAR